MATKTGIYGRRKATRFARVPFFGAEDPPGQPPQVPAGDPATTDANEPTTPPVVEDKTYTQAEVDRLINESKGYRKRAQDSEKALKEINDAQLSELDKTKKDAETFAKERDDARAELRRERFQAAVLSAAYKAKFNDPSDAISLISMNDVELDEDGKPKTNSLTSAIDRLTKSKPYLITPPSAGDGDGGARGTVPNNDKSAEWKKEYQDRGYVEMPA